VRRGRRRKFASALDDMESESPEVKFVLQWQLGEEGIVALSRLPESVKQRVMQNFDGSAAKDGKVFARFKGYVAAQLKRSGYEALPVEPADMERFVEKWCLEHDRVKQLFEGVPAEIQDAVIQNFDGLTKNGNVMGRLQGYLNGLLRRKGVLGGMPGAQAPAAQYPALLADPFVDYSLDPAVALDPNATTIHAATYPAHTTSATPSFGTPEELAFATRWGLDDEAIYLLRGLPENIKAHIIANFDGSATKDGNVLGRLKGYVTAQVRRFGMPAITTVCAPAVASTGLIGPNVSHQATSLASQGAQHLMQPVAQMVPQATTHLITQQQAMAQTHLMPQAQLVQQPAQLMQQPINLGQQPNQLAQPMGQLLAQPASLGAQPCQLAQLQMGQPAQVDPLCQLTPLPMTQPAQVDLLGQYAQVATLGQYGQLNQMTAAQVGQQGQIAQLPQITQMGQLYAQMGQLGQYSQLVQAQPQHQHQHIMTLQAAPQLADLSAESAQSLQPGDELQQFSSRWNMDYEQVQKVFKAIPDHLKQTVLQNFNGSTTKDGNVLGRLQGYVGAMLRRNGVTPGDVSGGATVDYGAASTQTTSLLRSSPY